MPKSTLKPQQQSDLVWGTILAVSLGYEAWALLTRQPEHTASHATRRWWRTHTRAGKAAFTSATVAGATWYLGHILRWWQT